MFIRVQQRLMDAAAVESYHENGGTEQGRSLECADLSRFCPRAERAIPEVKRAALRAVTMRRLVGALQDGASARM